MPSSPGAPPPPTWLVERTASSSGRRRGSDRPALRLCCRRQSRSADSVPCWAQGRARHMAAGTSRARGSLWSHMDVLLPQLLQLSAAAPAREPWCSIPNTGRWRAPGRESLGLPVTRIPSGFGPSHSSKQGPPPSCHIWQSSGHLVSFLLSFVLSQGGRGCTCM